MNCSDSDQDFLRQLAFTRSANLVAPSQNSSFDLMLKPIAECTGVSSSAGLMSDLRDDHTLHLHCAVAEAMTIHETSFFRDRQQFDVLQHTILPRLIKANSASRQLRIWSAASSTGQEAYSVAMLICEHFPELTNWDVTILGTDIDPQVIEYAKRGRYRRLEVNRGLAATMLVRHFERDGEEWQVAPRVRSICDFQHEDLCTMAPKSPLFDLVLLRNVLLCLHRQDRSPVFRSVHSQMTSAGYLVLGAAEQAEDSTDLYQAEFAKDCHFYRPAKRP